MTPRTEARRSTHCASAARLVGASLALALMLFEHEGRAQAAAPVPAGPTPPTASCPTLLNRQALRLQDEKPQNLCQYAGKVVVVVNTASFCGFTPQYKGLEALSAKYAPRGLVVLGFPSNDFGQQEPGSNQEIADFCENTFGVKFPMFTKTHVVAKGPGAVSPLFVDLRQRTNASPEWNFHKYVISRDGRTVLSFASDVEPGDPAFVSGIEKLLAPQ